MVSVLTAALGTAGADVDAVVREAREKVQAGDFLGAAAKFREAYRSEPKPDYVCNVGVAFHKAASRPLLAHLYLSLCLERGKGAVDRAFLDTVSATLDELEKTLKAGSFTPVDVTVTPATATVTIAALGPDDSFVGSRVVWLPWGEQMVTVSADGYLEQTQTITAAGHDRMALRVVLARPAPQPQPPQPQPQPQPAPVAVERRSLIPPIAASAVVVGAVAVSTVGFLKAHHQADIAAFAVTPDVFKDDKKLVDKWNTVFGVSAVVAVVAAGASGYLWYRALHPVTRLEVNAGPTGGSVTLRGRF